jgi:ubiquinone biosynthesis protein COQ4
MSNAALLERPQVDRAPVDRPVHDASEFSSKSLRLQPVTALKAMGRLIADKEDTSQVFIIMRALTGRSISNGYRRLLETPQGGRIALHAEELAKRLDDHDTLRTLPEGSVGRAYLAFMEEENLSAEGLAEESRRAASTEIDLEHPYAWYGRRLRDVHDIWHVLTGYGRDALGEACVVAFSYAQTKSLGFGFIAAAAAQEMSRHLKGQPIRKAVWEAYTHGRQAAWLPGEDYQALLAEPLQDARARLKVAAPVTYLAVPAALRANALTPTTPASSAAL